MKLLTAKKRKIAVLFTGGLGDTLLHVPLLKALKKKKFHITCIFYSRDNSDCLLDESLFDNKFQTGKKLSLLLFAVSHIKQFVNIYLNHLGKGKLIELTAWICSARITQTGDPILKKNKRHRFIPVETEFSDAEQNLHLLYGINNARIKNINEFYFEHPGTDRSLIENFLEPSRPGYFILQVSAGNNRTPYKNWPMNNWISLVSDLCINFSNLSFLVVGDEFEIAYTSLFSALNHSNCSVLIGKTSARDVFNLLAFSIGYIGLDSGIMHMAVALQIKTLTIFGASNEKLYGYSILDNRNHKVITSTISCRPCAAWINPNTSRVNNPMNCPDFACLASITKEEVYSQLTEHFNLS